MPAVAAPRRPTALAVVLAGALVAGAQVTSVAQASSSGPWRARPATYGVHVTKDVPIVMRDGVRLSADVFRPAVLSSGYAAPGRFPVVVVQTPYNKNVTYGMYADPAFLVSRGYVVVIVDVRGAGSSEGAFEILDLPQQRDGYDVVEWAADPRREWSNGAVGTSGCSYLGVTQLLTAAQQPPHLRTIVPWDAPGDIYRAMNQAAEPGLIPVLPPVIGGLSLLPPGYALARPDQAANAYTAHAGYPAAAAAAYAPFFAAGDGQRAFDGPFYRSRSPLWMIDKIRVPTFLVGGWHELFPRDMTLMFQALQAQGTPVRLLMGPWPHCTKSSALPADGLPTAAELELRWLDRFLAGRPDARLFHDLAPVTYYLPGEGHWQRSPSWPPPRTSVERLFLGGTGSAGTGRLQRGGSDAPPDPMVWHPAGGACAVTGLADTPCRHDERTNDAGALTYDVEIPADKTVAGYLSARLFVSTTGSDASVAVRVQDVAPDGSVANVSSGWATLSFRALDDRTRRVGDLITLPVHAYTRDSVLPVSSAKVYELWVNIWNTTHRFRRGHRLRLAILPSDVTGLPTSAAAKKLGLLRVHHDARHPSALVLTSQR